MQVINVKKLDYKALNEALRKADKDCSIEGCCGQRFIAAGMSGKKLQSMEYRGMPWVHTWTIPILPFMPMHRMLLGIP